MGNSDRNPIEVLASEFLERRRNNEQPTIEEYIARAPEFADEIPDVFEALIALEELKEKKESDGGATLGPKQLNRMGQYVIRRQIGRGGMGVVYDAVDESTQRRVAIKILPQVAMKEPTRLERFRREALMAATLEHPHIIPVLGIGEHDGLHYFVMQYIDGRGLDHWCTPHRDLDESDSAEDASQRAKTENLSNQPTCPAGERLGYREVARIGAEVASALQYAHDKGVIHRDIKPPNLMLDKQYRAWVADFGLAKATSGGSLTRPGQLLGTLRYMPPERLSGKMDARCDVYGVGITLYELLAGMPAICCRDRGKMVDLIRAGTPVPIRAVDPQVPADLEATVLKAMARQPDDRHNTARELAAEFERMLD